MLLALSSQNVIASSTSALYYGNMLPMLHNDFLTNTHLIIHANILTRTVFFLPCCICGFSPFKNTITQLLKFQNFSVPYCLLRNKVINRSTLELSIQFLFSSFNLLLNIEQLILLSKNVFVG